MWRGLLEPFLRSLARVAGEGKRRGGCCLFCNRRDARVRVRLALLACESMVTRRSQRWTLVASVASVLQVLDEPVARSRAGGPEILYVGIEMPAAQDHEALGFERPIERRECLVGDGKMIAGRDNHQKGRGAYARDVVARLVFGEHFDRAQGDLVAPRGSAGLAGLDEPLP